MTRDGVPSMVFLLILCFLGWFHAACSEVLLTQQSPVDLPCSGEEVVLQCTLPGTVVFWKFPSGSGEITLVPASNESPGNFRAQPLGVVNGNFTSTLTFPAENGVVITCINEDRSMNASWTVRVQGPPSVPSLSCVDLSGEGRGVVNVTVRWALSGGDSADYYLISIATNAPQTLYGGPLNITTASVMLYELTGFTAGYEYNITVLGVTANCGGLVGRESEPLTIRLQVPAVPSSCNITLSYNQSSRRLLFINSTWNSVPDPVDPGEECPGPNGNITRYLISFQNGSFVATENVNIAGCTAGKCSHTFEPPSNPPSSYDSVSVVAENVVGVGTPRTCTAQNISSSNNLLTGEVVGKSSPSDAKLNCIFLSGFNGSDHCKVQYGTDPNFMNLPYSAESNDTGSARDTVSVVLRERLNSLTVYYYTVSAVSGDVTATVLGTFTTPLYSCNLTELWDQPTITATFLSDVSSLDDAVAQYPNCVDESVGSVALKNTELNTATVAYYNGTTSGSSACFVCDEGYELNTTSNERVCQGNGLWSGNSIVCECRLPLRTISVFALSTIAQITTTVAATTAFIHYTYHYRKKGKVTWTTTTHIAVMNIFLILEVAFMIGGVQLTVNPPNGNACDPSWRSTRDGLFIILFLVSISGFIYTAYVIWSSFHNKRNMTKCQIVLLVIAAFCTIIGVGLWLALAVLFCIHIRSMHDQSDDPDVTDETDEHSEMTKRTSTKSSTPLDGSENKFELQHTRIQEDPPTQEKTKKAKKTKKTKSDKQSQSAEKSKRNQSRPAPVGSENKFELQEQPQYSTLQHPVPTSPDPLLLEDKTYSKLGEHGETGGGDIYNKPIHGGHHPHAVPNPADPTYSHLKEGASRPSAEELQYEVVSTEPRHKPKAKEEGKKKGRK